MSEDRKKVLYWDEEHHALERDFPEPEIIDGVEIRAVSIRDLAIQFFLTERDYDLVAIHDRSPRTFYFAQGVRKNSPNVIILGLTPFIDDGNNKIIDFGENGKTREEWMERLPEGHSFNDFMGRSYEPEENMRHIADYLLENA